MQYFDPKQYGKRIKEIREKRNMTQEELAIAVGYADARGIQKLESGDRAGSIDKLHDIAKVLEISTDYLLYGIHVTSIESEDPITSLLADKTPEERAFALRMLETMFDNKNLLVG